MKYLRLAWLCLLCVPPTTVCAEVVNGIDMLSSVYSINAPWHYEWYILDAFPPWESRLYSSDSGNYGGWSFDGSPLGGQITSAGPIPPGLGFGVEGSTHIDRFYFDNYTYSEPNGFALYGSDGNEYVSSNARINMQAQASWTFRPTGDSMQVALQGYGRSARDSWAGLSVSLSDVTTSSALLAWTSNWGETSLNVNEIFSVSTSDIYQLTVSGWADTYDMDWANQNVTASIQVVPEPSAFGLCLLGLLSLAGFKRWPSERIQH